MNDLPHARTTPDTTSTLPVAQPAAMLPLREPLRLSCVVPAYNEAGHLEDFLRALNHTVQGLALDWEIVLVNDGSKDATHDIALKMAQELPLRYVELSRNFGKEAAMSAGLDHARGNAVLLIDADFQHPLAMVAEMVQLWNSGYDMIYGVIADRAAESPLKRWGTNVFYYLMNKGNAVQIPANAGDFRLMDRKVVDALRQLPEHNRFMKGLYAWVGFKSVALPFVPEERKSGTSAFSTRKLATLAMQGLTSFTTLPLKVWSFIGACVSIVALVYGVYITIESIIFDNHVDGWPTLAAGLMLFSGVQLMSIGILGEYIGRIYEEVKRRPLYIVAHDEDCSPLTPRNPPSSSDAARDQTPR